MIFSSLRFLISLTLLGITVGCTTTLWWVADFDPGATLRCQIQVMDHHYRLRQEEAECPES